jgi:hypothetical protein
VRRGDDRVIAISVGELRAIVRDAVEEALARSRTKPAKRPKAADDAWSPARAAADAGLRVRR